jgi:hypothetical protein
LAEADQLAGQRHLFGLGVFAQKKENVLLARIKWAVERRIGNGSIFEVDFEVEYVKAIGFGETESTRQRADRGLAPGPSPEVEGIRFGYG